MQASEKESQAGVAVPWIASGGTPWHGGGQQLVGALPIHTVTPTHAAELCMPSNRSGGV